MSYPFKVFNGFNPRAPRGARPKRLHELTGAIPVSIHGLRGEPDSYTASHVSEVDMFQSTGSAGSPTQRAV